MRFLLTILSAVALVIVIAGAVNHAVQVRIDYLVGTASPVSLFWFGVAVAVLIVAAAMLGVLVGRGAAGDDRRKLETELEDTYRRLREAQAAAPARAVAPALAVESASFAPPTAVATPGEASTSVVAPESPEPGTAVEPVVSTAQTAVTPPSEESRTVSMPASGEPETVVSTGQDGEAGGRESAAETGSPAEPPPEDPPPAGPRAF